MLLIEKNPVIGSPGRALLDATALGQAFERQLSSAAPLYADGRQSGWLGPLAVRVLAPGAFERFRALRVAAGAASADQVKIPHVLPDPRLVSQYFGAVEAEE